jgi:hypothetical protein
VLFQPAMLPVVSFAPPIELPEFSPCIGAWVLGISMPPFWDAMGWLPPSWNGSPIRDPRSS